VPLRQAHLPFIFAGIFVEGLNARSPGKRDHRSLIRPNINQGWPASGQRIPEGWRELGWSLHGVGFQAEGFGDGRKIHGRKLPVLFIGGLIAA
jgi:hypothetical protein